MFCIVLVMQKVPKKLHIVNIYDLFTTIYYENVHQVFTMFTNVHKVFKKVHECNISGNLIRRSSEERGRATGPSRPEQAGPGQV